MTSNPSENIGSPKLVNKLPIVLDQYEITELIEQTDETTTLGLRDRALFEFAYATGVRVSELITVALADLSFDQQLVRIYGKGSRVRIVTGIPLSTWKRPTKSSF